MRRNGVMTQEVALAILKTGQNVFLTGEPGSGKTHTVNTYVRWLEGHDIVPAMTASTGIAATHVGGMTIHAWSGIGIRQSLTSAEMKQLMERESLQRRMLRAKVLIIDEISMLDGRTLSAVESVCRTVRKRAEPFGGLQVVFVGDFFQLPPVSRSNGTSQQTLNRAVNEPLFAFQSRAWELVNPVICYLSEQHRQEDATFHALLSEVRRGSVSEEGRTLLRRSLASRGEHSDRTRLFSHNADVDRVNEAQLARLPGEVRVFRMEAKGSDRHVTQLKKSCLSPEALKLKVGARVMFTKNQPELGCMNGTLGEVIGFAEEEVGGMPIVQTRVGERIFVDPVEWIMTDGTRTLAKIFQFPLRLAWAMTVHKSQGMTLDAAVVDLSRAFEYGQGYVALSRVRSSKGLRLLGWNDQALRMHPEVLAVDDRLIQCSSKAGCEIASLEAKERAASERAFINACGGCLEVKEKGDRVEHPWMEEGGRRKKRAKSPSTYAQTLVLFKEGKSLAEIAAMRGFTTGTIVSHVERLVMEDLITTEEVVRILPDVLREQVPRIMEAFRTMEDGKLSPIFAKFNGHYSYEDLKLVRLLMRDTTDSNGAHDYSHRLKKGPGKNLDLREEFPATVSDQTNSFLRRSGI
ncbi:AAA family ATPase [Candidatus Uhrbacteria bacterium]|nr:AAA family ATPase [Candidatus Uhrbacteria bacterium]MBD3284065.1 AAA family ATPase [Candidatus Uhrbacteria bacterium]